MHFLPEARRARLELAAVVATGALHLVFEEGFGLKAPFIALALLGWGGYVALSIRRERRVLEAWGLTLAGPGRAWTAPAVIFLAGAAALAVAGALRGTLGWTLHMVPLFALYPGWGVAQQFMVQAMVTRNLRGPAWRITLTAAVLFGAVHWPDRFLMASTFLLALLFTPLYLAHRRLLPLGLCHGWLGVLAYYWLLGRDPFVELMG